VLRRNPSFVGTITVDDGPGTAARSWQQELSFVATGKSADALPKVEAALDAAGSKKDPIEDMGGALSMEFLDPDGNRLVAVEIAQ
jgi:hypothetical protein